MTSLLEVKNIKTCFKTEDGVVTAVNGVSFHINRGEIVGIVGESGSGKSVSMLSIQQLITAPGFIESGEVRLEGVQDNILSYKSDSEQMRSIRGGRIGMIFQEPMTSLNPVLRIGFQVEENIRIHLGLKGETAKKKAIEMLRLVNIPDPEIRYDYFPQQFSGGMRQRIMIAIALAANPDILIADEATTALDVTTQAQLLEMIRSIAKKTNTAVILVTHNLGIVARFAERVYVMYSGNIVESAGIHDIFNNSQHPYTRSLIRAIPRLDDPKDRVLVPIKGLPPNPAARPDYCPFFDRCEYCDSRCAVRPRPELRQVDVPTHFTACWMDKRELDDKEEGISGLHNEKTTERAHSSEVVLALEGVKKYFPILKGIMRRKVGEVKAIEDISFTLRKGETIGLVGESGCGKTTLARSIMRAYQPENGRILLNGIDIARLNDRQLMPYRRKLAMIFQDPFSSLDPRQTAGSIVEESLLIHHLYPNRKERAFRVKELFELVGLSPNYINRVPHEFSGGQRQRLGIARALASNPDIIICDEPISALDVSIQAQIINLLEELQAKLSVSYLFIAHDLAVVKHISDRIVVMYLGRVVEIADCDALYNTPLHPYTQALLSAIPEVDPEVEAKKEAIKLQGEVPSIVNRPKGCPFHDRCPHCMAICREQVPPMVNAKNGHLVSCYLYQES